MMKLRFFPVNNAWAFTFGEDVRTMTVLTMANETRFFTKRSEAVAAGKQHNLTVDKNNKVTVTDQDR